MTLLDEIEAGCTGDAPLGVLLLKCKVLAARLKHQELADWIARELNGYVEVADLPDYRRHRLGGLIGTYQSRAALIRGAPVPVFDLPDDFREKVLSLPIFDSVAALESADGRRLIVKWTAEDLVRYNLERRAVLDGQALVEAEAQVPPGIFASILGTVRARILDFVLAIQAENPDAGEARPNAPPPVPASTVTQVFNTTIHGGHAIVGTSGGQASAGTGAVAAGGNVTTAGTVSAADFKAALADISGQLSATSTKLDAIDSDIYEFSSQILIRLRKLQLDGIPSEQVASRVQDAFEDDLVVGVVKEMKPGMGKQVAEAIGNAAAVANHPLAKAVGAAVAIGLAGG